MTSFHRRWHVACSSAGVYRFGRSLLVACLMIPGCGGREYDLAPVSGRVTLDGKPIADVLISFQPVSTGPNAPNPGPGSTGLTDAQGRFTLRSIEPEERGAVVGKHVVRLTTAHKDTNPADDAAPVVENILPASCLDGSMTFQVEPDGTDVANFDVQSL